VVLVEQANGIHHPIKGARLVAEIIVYLSSGAVETQRDHFDPGLLDTAAGLLGDQGAVGGQTHA
jgi:hypothetical protein